MTKIYGFPESRLEWEAKRVMAMTPDEMQSHYKEVEEAGGKLAMVRLLEEVEKQYKMRWNRMKGI